VGQRRRGRVKERTTKKEVESPKAKSDLREDGMADGACGPVPWRDDAFEKKATSEGTGRGPREEERRGGEPMAERGRPVTTQDWRGGATSGETTTTDRSDA